MKMAKASKEEWEKVMKFATELTDEIDCPSMSNEELGRWVRKSPPLFRIVFGYEVLVNNCCDPKLDTLEWKPEIADLMEKNEASKSRQTSEKLWCAMCGQWGDHQSGTCPQLPHKPSNEVKL